MGNALIVSATQSGFEKISSLILSIAPKAFSEILYAQTQEHASAMAKAQNNLSFVVINMPQDGLQKLAVFLNTHTQATILLLHKGDLQNSVFYEDLGIFTLQKPFKRSEFMQYVKIASTIEKKTSVIQLENAKLKRQLSELGVIHRSKCVLMQQRQMSEDAAHHYIEKQAMQHRKSKYDICLNILKSYKL